jgi:hypothetical protein
MSARRPPQRKGKTTIPKPARGSGLNPSHAPADTQINLPDEQPQPPMMSFHPYQQSPLDYPSFDNYLTSFASAGQTNPGDTSRYGNSLSGAGYSNPPPSAPYINSLTAAGYGGSNVVVNTSRPISGT